MHCTLASIRSAHRFRVSFLAGILAIGLCWLSSSPAWAQQKKKDDTKAVPQQGFVPKAGPAAGKAATGSWMKLRLWFSRYWIYLAAGGGAVAGGLLLLIVRQVQKNKEANAPAPGSSNVIGGYRLQNLMMTGQTSQVWEVVEAASGRHFAMKLLLPEKLQDPEHRELLFHEAEVGMLLAHPNVIRVIKVDKNVHNPYFVMEFFPAGNLKLRVMHKKWDFIKEKSLDIFKQAGTALAYMHAMGWVHRDVKPDNIMVNSAGEVRIIDFALAQKIAVSRSTAGPTSTASAPAPTRW
jgi:Protein kinase domain